MPQSGKYNYECSCDECQAKRKLQIQQLVNFIKTFENKVQIQPELEEIIYTTTQKNSDFIWNEAYYLPEDTTTGNDAMTGHEYVQDYNNFRANYTHLRAMLQHAWKNAGQGVPFDIDTRFQRNISYITQYLRDTFTYDQLNKAHLDARATYSRGRPKGARNIDKVKPNIDTEDVFKVESSQIENAVNQIKRLEQDTNQDMSNFVTHPQLAAKAYVNNSDLIRVVNNCGDALKQYIEEELAKIKLNTPTTIEIKRTNLPTIQMGTQHRCFPTLLKMCNAALRNSMHLNVWVYGPAGTGKSTAAELIAQALTLDFYTLGKQSTEYGILGFINVSGYQTTEFRRAYENGGIFCGDEIDGWMPDALIALNMALANGHCAFPDKMIKRHPNFIFIACANTVGTGATMDYVGRMKQDAAFLDRFVSLYWPLDETLEDSLVANKQWLSRVRYVRNRVQQVGIKGHLITPRAAIFGEALLAAGLSIREVEQSTLQKGLSGTQWNQVKPVERWVEDVEPIFDVKDWEAA